LITGEVPELGEWVGENKDFIRHFHSELAESFETIKAHQQPEKLQAFFEQAYVFFNAQEVDRVKELSNPNYTNEDLYIPVILKSSYSRLIARSVLSASEDSGFDSRTFYYGIYNQLADDFADMFEDFQEGRVTPYTYYLKYSEKRPELINPFELYWTVISNLIHNVYHSDPKTCEVILDRAINGLKRFKTRIGTEKYEEVMKLFASASPEYFALVQKMVQEAEDVDFLDKLLRDRMITFLKKEKMEQEAFRDTVKNVGEELERSLAISKGVQNPLLNQTLTDAANYSLEAGGKHVRSLMAWAMGVKGYGLDLKSLAPLLRALEYMHTASLIFDDLPSQDNADFRRGKPTLHMKYNIGIAELTGLFLTQKAVEDLTSLNSFPPKAVLSVIRYTACTIEDMCKGQVMDLTSKGKDLTLDELKTMVFYKTGLAFEASLVMPALLVQEKEPRIETLKEFARHAGIAFQIKDDLLDAEGDQILLGKRTGKDAENQNATFVTLLGLEGARKELWEHYCQAMEALLLIPL
jgi:geranylgeranyl pyrophosphate synthase